MAVFAFYNFQISKSPKSAEICFPDRPPQPILNNQQELFQTLFIEKASADLQIPIPRKDRIPGKPSTITHKNEVLANYDDIIVMTVENNKIKTTINEKQKVDHPHNPYCNVIIDYRPEQCLLAIEKSSAFDNQPEKLKIILQIALNRLFSTYGYTITFTQPKMLNLAFWEAITEIRLQNKDKVKKICIDFHDSGKSKKTKPDHSGIWALLAALAKKADANGLAILEANEDGEVNIEAIHEDLVHIADICYRQKEYDLTVYFSSYGIYKYGADLVAQFGISDEIIQNHTNGVEELDLFERPNTLSNWLKGTKELLMKKYVNAASITGPAKQSRRR